MTDKGLYDLDHAYKVAELAKNGDEKRLINGKKVADICSKGAKIFQAYLKKYFNIIIDLVIKMASWQRRKYLGHVWAGRDPWWALCLVVYICYYCYSTLVHLVLISIYIYL